MDAENRPAGDRLALMQALASAPHSFSFFQAVRLLECTFADKPRVGTSLRLADDPIRLGQQPELDFAPATLASFHPGAGASATPKLRVRFQGLTGPNGPLPLHLTEYVRDRMRNAGDTTLVDFLDLFHHRMLAMFYRAWADAQPAVSLDRADHDNFGRWIASLAGYGLRPLRGRDAVPDGAKLAAAGLLGRSIRHAEGLSTLLAGYFRVPAKVQEWYPHWLELPADSRTRIGAGQASARLGLTAVAGRRVWDCQSGFLVILGPLTLDQFKRFLPGQASMRSLKDWILNYCGFELICSVRLILLRDQVPAIRLGRQGQLGQTTWLGRWRRDTDADDLEMRVA